MIYHVHDTKYQDGNKHWWLTKFFCFTQMFGITEDTNLVLPNFFFFFILALYGGGETNMNDVMGALFFS